MTVHLTDLIVKKLNCRPRAARCTTMLRQRASASVSPRPVRKLVLNYRTKAGRERRMTIGRFGNWSTLGARDKAKELRRLIDAGGDPLAGIEAERAAPTMADLIERFEAEHMPRLRPETQKNYRQMIKNHIAPRFGSRVKVADVGYPDCDALHRWITKPFAANRTRSVLSKMFTLANRWGWRSDNPTKSVERNPEAKRKRYLSADQLTRLTRLLAEHPNRQVANIVRMLLLTGARVGEVRSMRWADISDGVLDKARVDDQTKMPITSCRCRHWRSSCWRKLACS